MSELAFYWIGVGVVVTLGAIAILFVAVFLYASLLHGRFSLIFFRKGERRISIASWYNAKLMNNEHFNADDFPIAPRPFYLSYRYGNRRIFIMAGILEPHRHSFDRVPEGEGKRGHHVAVTAPLLGRNGMPSA